jgi:DNA-binding NarL/FixJ family response regulator
VSRRTRSMAQAGADCVSALVLTPGWVFAQDDRPSAGRAADLEAPILVVEDDFLVAMQIEAALTEAGFALSGTAASGEEAIAMATAIRPVFVLMDIRLAGEMDGVDAALALFRQHGIRCIFATAHHDLEVRRRAAPAEPLGWLQKPYSMPALLEAVRQGLADLKADSD